MAGGKPKLDWNSVDWSQQNRDIAAALHCSDVAVASRRRRLDKPKPALWHKHRDFAHRIAQWSRLDWRLTNAKLGRQMGVGKERARQIRQFLGKPKSTIREPYRSIERRLEILKARLHALRGMKVREAELMLGYPLKRRTQARKFLDMQGVLRPGSSKHPWHLMNFALGDAHLSQVWTIRRVIVSQHRIRRRRGYVLWHGSQYRAGRPDFHDPQFQQALVAERAKARRWRNGQAETPPLNEAAAAAAAR